MSDKLKCSAGQKENLPVLSDSPAVFAKTAIGVQVSASRCEQTDQVVRVKPKWDKCDKYRYREIIAHSLKSAPSNIENELDFLFALGHMTSVLKTATSKSIPNHKSVINVKSKKLRIWNDKIKEAVKEFKTLWWEWKVAGSPCDPEHALNIKRNKIKRKIRSEQRKVTANRKNEKVERIMTAKPDSKNVCKTG